MLRATHKPHWYIRKGGTGDGGLNKFAKEAGMRSPKSGLTLFSIGDDVGVDEELAELANEANDEDKEAEGLPPEPPPDIPALLFLR